MHVSIAHKHIQELTNNLQNLFSNVKIDFAFGHNRPLIGDCTNDKNLGILGGDNVGDKSGIYIFSTDDDQVIYIGKATKNNLHNRVWSQVGTPSKIMADGWRHYPKTKFKTCSDNPELVELVCSGKIRLHVFTVSDPEVTSLIEVYLQTQHVKFHGKLPAFNKQIG